MKRFILVLLVSVCVNTVQAQWEQTQGIFGGKVNCMTTKGIFTFAGTENGIYLSTDKGHSWSPAKNGFSTGTIINAFLIVGNDILAATNEGLFKSSNNGVLWERIDKDFTNWAVKALINVGTTIFAGTNDGMFISSDLGKNWVAAGTGLVNAQVTSFAVVNSTILAGIWGQGVAITTDKGASWTMPNTGLKGNLIQSLAVIGTSVYATSLDSGVFASNDNGITWMARNTGLTNLYTSTLIANGADFFLSSGSNVFISSNQGALWTHVDSLTTSGAINCFMIEDSVVTAGANHGIFQSFNYGKNWTKLSNRFSSLELTCIAANAGVLYAATTYGGIYRTFDNGNSYSRYIPPTGKITAMEFLDSILFVATKGNGVLAYGPKAPPNNWQLPTGDVKDIIIADKWLYAATDMGIYWMLPESLAAWNLRTPIITSRMTLSKDRKSIYSASDIPPYTIYYGGVDQEMAVPMRVTAIEGKGDYIFAGTAGGVFAHNLFTSVGWEKSSFNSYVNSIKVIGTTVIAGTNEGVFLSKNSGDTWTPANEGLTDLHVISVAIKDSTVFIGTAEDGIFKRSLSDLTTFNAYITDHSNACDGSCKGSANVTANAGTGPFRYAWAPSGDTTATVTGLCAGTHTVTITDLSNMKTATDSITITAPSSNSLTLAVTGNREICVGTCSEFAAIATGGSSGYRFYWTSTKSNASSQTICPVNDFYDTVSVTDGRGCRAIVYDTIRMHTLVDPYFAYPYELYSTAGNDPTPVCTSPGGRFSCETSGLAIDSITGKIDLSASAEFRDYKIIYTTNGFCKNTGYAFVSVTSPVWPGDANSDSTVNNNDILPIGLYYDQGGFPRDSTSNLWEAKPCLNWLSSVGTVNSKHADCNGDGVVNQGDMEAIQLNFNATHTIMSPVVEKQQASSDLYVKFQKSVYKAGDWVDAEIRMGSTNAPVNSLYGVAFKIIYDKILVEPNTESISYPSGWLGTKGVTAITFEKIDPSNAAAYAAITRIDHSNANGSGVIANFRFRASTALKAESVLHVTIDDYMANDANGTLQTFNTFNDSISVHPVITGVTKNYSDSEVRISPNPFSSETTVYFSEAQKNSTIRIIDILGKEIQSVRFSGTTYIIERREMKNGIYFIQIVNEQMQVINKKIIIE